ncbi:MAG: hypothetical protein N3B16_07245 [Candidatus Aminicenantes bacterium]|nr:hypothetical protein [Candidatus Aminicenantes bacterium]
MRALQGKPALARKALIKALKGTRNILPVARLYRMTRKKRKCLGWIHYQRLKRDSFDFFLEA